MTPTPDENSILPADPLSAQTSSPPKSMLRRIFSRHLMNMALLMLLPMILLPDLNFVRGVMVDPDIWWHLADARIVLSTHHLIHTDPYAFSVIGKPWLDWEWLAEVPYWFSYRFLGLRGIYLLDWLAFAANLLFVYWRANKLSGHAGAAFWAACIALVLMSVNSGPRTIAFGYLAMSAEMAILEAADRGSKKFLWLLPPLFAVWINLHGTWFMGVALFGLYIVCGLFPLNLGVFEQQALSPKDRLHLLAVFGVSLITLFANPYGWRLMWSPIDMMVNQKISVATITEWQPLTFSSLEGKGALAAICLMVIANCIRGRKWKIYELAIVLLAWYSAFAHHRFTYLAAILTTPMLARDMQRSFCTESDEKTIPLMNALFVAGSVCAMVLLFPSENQLSIMLAKMFPLQTIAAVQPSWRTLNWDYVGGRMDFESKSPFIDSRFDSFEHDGVLDQYDSIIGLNHPFELMDKYRIDHALIKEESPLSTLLRNSPEWRVESREKAWSGYYVLFAKTSGVKASPPCAPPIAAGKPQGAS